MEKVIKVIFFKNELVLISEIVEIVADIGEPDCKLINPCKVDKQSITNGVSLESWPDYTFQNEIMIHSESILTLVDPKPTILEKYIELISE